MNKSNKLVKNIKNRAPRIIAGAALVYGLFLITHHRLVPIEGHFIRKADFQRMLDTDDILVVMTPLGDFRVTPI